MMRASCVSEADDARYAAGHDQAEVHRPLVLCGLWRFPLGAVFLTAGGSAVTYCSPSSGCTTWALQARGCADKASDMPMLPWLSRYHSFLPTSGKLCRAFGCGQYEPQLSLGCVLIADAWL